MVQVDRVLATYTLEEILEYNDLTEEDLLSILLEEDLITLPNPKPVDYD